MRRMKVPVRRARLLMAAALLFLAEPVAAQEPGPVWPKLTTEQLAEVQKYRAEGEALHKAGKHQESVDTLAKAKKILGIQ